MSKVRTAVLSLILALGSTSVFATELNCKGTSGNLEDFRYSWRLRGGLSWIAGLILPTWGSGQMLTRFPAAGIDSITSQLLITAPTGKTGGFFEYETAMDGTGTHTLMSSNGYAWGDKAREETAHFDYKARVARIRKETPEKVENKTKPLPEGQLRDVLSAIYFLRQNASRITKPMLTEIYSDGKEYPVVFRPIARKTFEFDGRRVGALGFEIVDAPSGKKWPGSVKVYISEDERRIPFRIEIVRSIASVELNLQSVEACGFMQAAK
jgi:hypothetical protein